MHDRVEQLAAAARLVAEAPRLVVRRGVGRRHLKGARDGRAAARTLLDEVVAVQLGEARRGEARAQEDCSEVGGELWEGCAQKD